MKPTDLERIFTYHRPHGDQAQRYEQLRAAGLVLADKINRLAPDSGEKTLAIRRVQEAIMYATAAIAINEPFAPAAMSECAICRRPILPGQSTSRLQGGAAVHAIDADCCPDPKP